MTDQPKLSEMDEALAGEIVVAENVTFEEFLTRFVDEHVEWIDGKVILLTMTNNKTHQIILGTLYALFLWFLGLKQQGQVFMAGMPMRLAAVQRGREPDLLIFLNEHLDRVKQTYIDGAADIVVEIVSPESEERDYVKKLGEYARGGVPEYWLVDPIQRQATVYVLGEDGRYQVYPLDPEGRLQSRVLPGFSVHPDLLWREQPLTSLELVELMRQVTDAQA